MPIARGLLFTLVGALLSSRLPANPIGWICLSIGLALMLAGAADGYARMKGRPALWIPGADHAARSDSLPGIIRTFAASPS